jgi:hypothetical protein
MAEFFQEQWTTEFGVIENSNKALCCLCSETVVSRTFNVKRHFEKNHKNDDFERKITGGTLEN